jgi:hypothetical protein
VKNLNSIVCYPCISYTESIVGALSEDDIKTFQTGFIMILPNDRCGNFVLSLEPCKAANTSPESQRRCYFYLLFLLLSDHRLNGTEKIVFLTFLNDLEDDIFSTCATTFVDIGKVFPLDVAFVHGFFEPVGLGWLAYQRNAISLLTKLLSPPANRSENHNFEDISGDIFALSYNFDCNNLPVRFGGKWSMESFVAWRTNRTQIEIIQMMMTTTTNMSQQQQQQLKTNCNEISNMNVVDKNNNVNHHAVDFTISPPQQQHTNNNQKITTRNELAAIPYSQQQQQQQTNCDGISNMNVIDKNNNVNHHTVNLTISPPQQQHASNNQMITTNNEMVSMPYSQQQQQTNSDGISNMNMIDKINNVNHHTVNLTISPQQQLHASNNQLISTNNEIASMPYSLAVEITNQCHLSENQIDESFCNLITESNQCNPFIDDVKEHECSSTIADDDTFSINTNMFDEDEDYDNDSQNDIFPSITIAVPNILDMRIQMSDT